ncbi:MAG: peptidylprolyl isomerase [Acidobacteriota bacterium]
MKALGIAAVLASSLVIGSALAQGFQNPGQAAKPAGTEKAAPAPVAKVQSETVAVLQTTAGRIVLRFFPGKAPLHVKNFVNLCRSGFYNGTKFHRVLPGFVIQGGDPNTKGGDPSTWGTGGNVGPDGKEITVKAEFNDVHHARGILSMARASDPDSASSQFFICVGDAGPLDRQYTAFGEVIEGMDVVDKIVSAPTVGGATDPEGSRPKNPVSITKAWIEKRSLDGNTTPVK